MAFGLLAAVGAQGESWAAMSASGGTETTYTDSGRTWKVHTFNSSGTFTVSNAGVGAEAGYVKFLVVSGGAGGGGAAAAGGSGIVVIKVY